MYQIVLRDATGKLVVVRIGDELIVEGLPAHKMRYVGPIGPFGEDVVDPPKAQAARFVHLTSIPKWERLRVGERGPEPWDLRGQQAVQARARQIVANRVVNQPLGPNCEHIGTQIARGNPKSPQLRAAVGVGLAIIIFWMLGG
jgi:hypothetical protein